jgi:hypothetical protein
MEYSRPRKKGGLGNERKTFTHVSEVTYIHLKNK